MQLPRPVEGAWGVLSRLFSRHPSGPPTVHDDSASRRALERERDQILSDLARIRRIADEQASRERTIGE